MALTKAHNRMIEGAPVNVKDFGAVKGTGQTSTVRQANSAAFNSALATGLEVLIPSGEYELDGKVSQTIDGQSCSGWGATLYFYHNDDHAWEIGQNTSGSRTFQAVLQGVKLEYRGAGYSAGNVGGSVYAGLHMAQTYESIINGVSANYFAYGLYMHATYTAVYYNRIQMREIEYCAKGIYVHAEQSGANYGLISANTIYAQRIQQCTIGVETLGDSITSPDLRPGDNFFIDVSIEHGTGSGTYGVLENGKNIWLEPRIDGTWTANGFLLNTNSERCRVTGHLFFLGEGLTVTNLGSENYLDIRGYREDIQVNSSSLLQRFSRTGANSKINLVSSSFSWTQSGSGTSTYFCRTSANGELQRNVPKYPVSLLENNSAMTFNSDITALSAGEWGVGDSDSLGYKTIYVRLSDNTDPDSKAADYVQCAGAPVQEIMDLKTFSNAGNQVVNKAAATHSSNSYFDRGVDSETGEERWFVNTQGYFGIKDGVAAPSARTGMALIYVDSAGGDLKIVFSDGTVKTIVTDS